MNIQTTNGSPQARAGRYSPKMSYCKCCLQYSVDEVFMHYFEKMSSTSRNFAKIPTGDLPLDPTGGLPPFRSLHCSPLKKILQAPIKLPTVIFMHRSETMPCYSHWTSRPAVIRNQLSCHRKHCLRCRVESWGGVWKFTVEESWTAEHLRSTASYRTTLNYFQQKTSPKLDYNSDKQDTVLW